MKKLLALILVLILIFPLCACNSEQLPDDDSQQTTTVDTSPNNAEPEPNEKDKNNVCDDCDHYDLTDEYDIAQIVIDYEESLRDEIDKLNKEKNEYHYCYNQVDWIRCKYKLDSNASADAIVEIYDMNNEFAKATVSAFDAINTKNISIIFDRNDFTETIYQKIKQISEEEPLIEDLFIYMERDWVKIYMPKIQYYTDNETVLDYEITNYVINPLLDKSFIIKSKDQYDNYLNDLFESAEHYYSKELIIKQMGLYDEIFFEENALIVTNKIMLSSGSIKLTVDNLYVSQNKVYVVIKTYIPSVRTDDIKYELFTLKVPKSKVADVNEVITLE